MNEQGRQKKKEEESSGWSLVFFPTPACLMGQTTSWCPPTFSPASKAKPVKGIPTGWGAECSPGGRMQWPRFTRKTGPGCWQQLSASAGMAGKATTAGTSALSTRLCPRPASATGDVCRPFGLQDCTISSRMVCSSGQLSNQLGMLIVRLTGGKG